jgi:hypothetical protein
MPRTCKGIKHTDKTQTEHMDGLTTSKTRLSILLFDHNRDSYLIVQCIAPRMRPIGQPLDSGRRIQIFERDMETGSPIAL